MGATVRHAHVGMLADRANHVWDLLSVDGDSYCRDFICRHCGAEKRVAGVQRVVAYWRPGDGEHPTRLRPFCHVKRCGCRPGWGDARR